MIWKLSLTGVKSRLKDYLVLFSGLTVASMVFYMFLTIAINPAFISKDVNSSTNYLNFTFGFGIVLLVIITFVYLTYANSFLLSMRKHDYGMFMSLGAKSSRIGLLIFSETLLTGIVATALGILLGFGLTAIVSHLLITQLNLAVSHFQVIFSRAILWTFIFFIIMFFLGALRNVRKLTHTQVISLLKEDQNPVKINSHPAGYTIEAVLGVVLLGAGYFIMNLSAGMIFFIIPAALFTIVLGSYFTFNSFFSVIINFLIKRKSFSYHKIRMFTLGQLKFRLHDYTKILTVISLLFALALGAITVGLNFDSLKDQVKDNTYYDTTIVSKSSVVKNEVAKLSIARKQTYHYKENKGHIYFMVDEFSNQPIKSVQFYLKNNLPQYKIKTMSTKELDKPHTKANNALSALVPNGFSKKIKLMSKTQWLRQKGTDEFISLIIVKNFEKDYPLLLKIQDQQLKENTKYTDIYNSSKPVSYKEISNFSSGFEFMGFFLGFAFLAMLASTLMFKVLSGAASDKLRYQMLYQMGVRRRTLQDSIKSEIGMLFLLPGVLGVIDVLFGLKLFKVFFVNPYSRIWIPFTIFIVLYLFYYLLTVKLYEKIVLS